MGSGGSKADSGNSKFRIPTQNEHKRFSEVKPDAELNPMTEEQMDWVEVVIENRRENEKNFPLLKQDEDGLKCFIDRLESRGNKGEWIKRLGSISVRGAIQEWLKNLNSGTAKNYAYRMQYFIRNGVVDGKSTVGVFNEVPHELVVDKIKCMKGLGEGTKQGAAACYISFTGFLARISHGWFRKAIPSTLGSNKTFYQVRDKCATETLTLHEWHRFISELYKKASSERDVLMAKAMLQGAKRVSEVLSLEISQIDFSKNIINFKQSKSGGTIRHIPITYPQEYMEQLKTYVDETESLRKDGMTQLVFLTGRGNGVHRSHLNVVFREASKRAGISKVTPHMLRATWVTLAKKEGVPDTEIMKVTGHTSSKMIYCYDKTSAEDNYSKRLVLI